MDRLDADRRAQLPGGAHEPAGPLEEPVHLLLRMGEVRLVALHLRVHPGQRVFAPGERAQVVQRPAAEGDQGAGRIVGVDDATGDAQLAAGQPGREGCLGADELHFLADPAVDRRWRDRVADCPLGPGMLEADRRPHQPRARADVDPAVAERLERQIGFGQAGLDALRPLGGADHRGAERPAELGLPDDVGGCGDGANPGTIGVSPEAQLAETALDPGPLSVRGEQPDVAGQDEGVGREKLDAGLGPRGGGQGERRGARRRPPQPCSGAAPHAAPMAKPG